MESSYRDQIKCVEREIAMRRAVYPRQVARGKMSQEQADWELTVMQEVRETVAQASTARGEGALAAIEAITEAITETIREWKEDQGDDE